jgi:hypothetical protein
LGYAEAIFTDNTLSVDVIFVVRGVKVFTLMGGLAVAFKFSNNWGMGSALICNRAASWTLRLGDTFTFRKAHERNIV